MIRALYRFLRRNPMMEALFDMRGNQRVCVYTEILWGIPNSLYMPFVTIYMYLLGVNDAQIGLILTVGMALQVVTSLLSGVITDKFGRRRVTFYAELFAWSLPALIWAGAQSFWWFVAAGAINAVWQIPYNSWSMLMVEDADPKHLVGIFSWLNIASLVPVFLAPLSGIFVARWGVVPVVRVLYVLFFFCMTLKNVLVYRYSRETTQGVKRMAETRGIPLLKLLGGYKKVFFQILHTPHTLLAIGILALLNITTVITNNFFSLYAMRSLGVPEAYVSYFPLVRAAVMLYFMFAIQHRLNRLPFRIPMGVGLVFFAAGQGLLLLTPPGTPLLLVATLFCEAFGQALVMPRKDSLFVTFVDPEERSAIFALSQVMVMGVSAPFAWLTGILSQHNQRLPFYLSLGLFVALLALILFHPDMRRRSATEQQ